MATTVLSPNSCYSSGSDLWVLPDLSLSKNTQRIDWYLNFQINKAKIRNAKRFPIEIENILDKTGLPKLDFVDRPQNKLLISSSELLPNRWVLQLEGSQNFSEWVSEIHKTWEQLQHTSLRVFLPPGVETKSFLDIWSRFERFEDLSIVLESSS